MATANLMTRMDSTSLNDVVGATSAAWILGLTGATAAAVEKAGTQQSYRPGERVYTEGEPADGAYIVRQGKVKLVASSSDGKALILRIALPGQVIGLSAALSERVNDTSAEVIEPTLVTFVKTRTLYYLMDSYGDLSLRLAQELSVEYSSLCQELSTLGLQRSAMSRLAKLLVGLTESVAPQQGNLKIDCCLTHEEMAQMIGTSRETVTRLLRELRDHQVAILKHDTLVVTNPPALAALVE